MHIAIVGVKWPAETFLQRKIEGLAALGERVTVAAYTSESSPISQQSNLTFIRLPNWRDSVLKRTLRLFYLLIRNIPRRHTAYLWRIAQTKPLKLRLNFMLSSLLLANIQADVVHFEWNSSAAEFDHMLSIWSAPVVVSCRGAQVSVRPHTPGNEDFTDKLRLGFKHATVVHCVSEAIREEAIALGLDRSKARVIRPAVDTQMFTPALNRDARFDTVFRVVSVGQLIWRKGFEYALVAIHELIAQGISVEYNIIGDGDEKNRLLFTIFDLNLQDNVILHGKQPPSVVRDHLQNADVFLLSSLSEGIANVALEGMACGLPLVTTDCGGMREVISDGVEGFIVPICDAPAMALAIKKLFENRQQMQNMGKAARQRIEQAFTLDQQITQFTQMYQSLASRQSKSV